MDLVGPIAIVFDLISSEYNWDDEVILNKTLRRIRQIIAAITLRKKQQQREQRLMLSWQTRSLAMVTAAAGASASEELMTYAANLTIDNDEYEEFGRQNTTPVASKTPVHAATQDTAVQKNFEAAADRNNFDMLALFGMK
ncbi:MAG: hypothetical protein L6R40_008772, partial [Gallowayella cf. fulva]